MEGVGGGEIKINSFFLNLMAVRESLSAITHCILIVKSCVDSYDSMRGIRYSVYPIPPYGFYQKSRKT